MEAYLQTLLQKFQHLKIQLEEIKSATNNFDDQKNYIGRGGFGNVYKGELSHSKGRSMVAVKRLNLDPKKGPVGQGAPEFLKEITMLSDYKHENLISLLGFCCEGNEMILVYEHASRGSLDRYLNSPNLTWTQRLKICLDAGKGLNYLHDPRETHRRLIHCDVKSGNILLDDQWNAKVSDLGLSQMGTANEQHSLIVTLAAGTEGYIDPLYRMTHTLTKASDVYSFGVVLFEVLCGTLCYTYSNGRVQSLVPAWKGCYEEKKLNDIIFRNPTIQPLDRSALEILSDIAYRCLKESREDRPTMAEVVIELETALENQEISVWEPPFDYDEMTKTAEPPLNYSSNGELWKLLSKGVLLNAGKTWFSLNKKGEHCEMISFREFVDSSHISKCNSDYNSRFLVGTYHFGDGRFKTHVKTQFLSPGITYTVNLVFKFPNIPEDITCPLMSLRYKLQGETESSVSYFADKREDGWWVCELYQFVSDHRTVDLQIMFEGCRHSYYIDIEAEGIEFRPLEKVEHKEKNQLISDLDANWEEKMPTDYEDIMKLSTYSVTKKEAYSIIRKGLLIDDGQKWFSLDNNGKKCHMLSAPSIWHSHSSKKNLLHFPKSRFGEAFQCDSTSFYIIIFIQSKLLSSQTTYGCYLVYKLLEVHSQFEAPMRIMRRNISTKDFLDYYYIYLVRPQTPVIRPKDNQNTHNPLSRLQIKRLPQQRNDGWMEVQIWEFETSTPTPNMSFELEAFDEKMLLSGLIIEGVEFRPI